MIKTIPTSAHPEASLASGPSTGSGRASLLGAALAVLALLAIPIPATAQTAQERVSAYRERVERLEDQVAIENLQASFGYYFDKGLWGEAAALFSRQGRFEYGQQGIYITPARIERAMLLFGPEGLAPGILNNHMMLQSVVIVADDGRTATGRWQGMVMLGQSGQTGQWGVGVYENTYVLEGGVWKISGLHFYPLGFTDYDKGWMQSQIPMEGPSALFPPDLPPSEVYRALPGVYTPQFSYPHPVTGARMDNIPQPPDDVVGRP